MEYIVDINNKNYKKIKIRKIIKYCDKNNLKLKFNYIDLPKEQEKIFNQIEKAINIKDIEKRYSFIYDTVCDYLDNKYFKENLCNFKNNVCEYYREIDPSHYNGCCYRSDRSLCQYFNEEKRECTERGISCKLYSCPILRKKKINYKISNIPLLNYFFNIKQKMIIKYSFFKPKPYVMYKLMEVYNENHR